MKEDFEIEIPRVDGESKFSTLKSFINFIATTAGLILAVNASIKKEEGNTSKIIYEEMSTKIKEMHKNIQDTRDDQIKIRSYIDHYIRSSSVVGPSSDDFIQSNGMNAPVILIPIDKSKIRTFPGSNSQPVLVLPSITPPSIPDSSGPLEKINIKNYEELISKGDMNNVNHLSEKH
jgi:hypothetical protein